MSLIERFAAVAVVDLEFRKYQDTVLVKCAVTEEYKRRQYSSWELGGA